MIRRWRVSKRGFLRIPLDKPFEEAYFTHRMWMFFRETKETEEDIRRMFHQVREKMRQRITLKKKSDPGKFVIPSLIGGTDNPSALCDTCSSVSILPKVMADHLGLKIEFQRIHSLLWIVLRGTEEESLLGLKSVTMESMSESP